MIRRVKLLEIAAESPASGARFVRRDFVLNTLLEFYTAFKLVYGFISQET